MDTTWVHFDRWSGKWRVECQYCDPTWLGDYSSREAADAYADAHNGKALHLGMGVDSADP